MQLTDRFWRLIEKYCLKIWLNKKNLYFSVPNIIRKKLELSQQPKLI